MRCPITAVAVVAVCGTLLGCAGADKSGIAAQQGTEGIRPPKAQAYVCEGCGYRFGVPFDLPVRQQVFPPIVCPKCGLARNVEPRELHLEEAERIADETGQELP